MAGYAALPAEVRAAIHAHLDTASQIHVVLSHTTAAGIGTNSLAVVRHYRLVYLECVTCFEPLMNSNFCYPGLCDAAHAVFTLAPSHMHRDTFVENIFVWANCDPADTRDVSS
jgi:hypothetical protein